VLTRSHTRPQPKIHRVDPESGSTLRLSDREFQSDCRDNLRVLGQPCGFYLPCGGAQAMAMGCAARIFWRGAATTSPGRVWHYVQL
jgi:hypothetical protein